MCWWPEDTEKEEQRGGGKVALVACVYDISRRALHTVTMHREGGTSTSSRA